MNVDEIAAAVLAGAEQLFAKRVEPLLARIAELEAREYPKAEEVASAAVQALLAGDGIKSLVDLEVTAYMEANPPEKGEKGDPGEDGKDGAGVADLLVDRDGAMVATFTDGRMKNLGQIIGKDGQDGKDGRDGLGFDDLTVSFDGDAIVHEYKRGDQCKSVRFPLNVMRHIGFWREGMAAKSGNTVTNSGSLWLCLNDTQETPSYQAKDWILAARAGRDGQDKTDAKPSQPVKLNG